MTMDIQMMRKIEGCERTLKQYEHLLADHGFKIEKTVRTPGDMYACYTDAMLAIKE